MMGGLVMIIGGLSVVFGAFDLWDFGDSRDDKDWKKPVTKIVGGLVVVCIGALMKHFGI